jgi:hypothetical protein
MEILRYYVEKYIEKYRFDIDRFEEFEIFVKLDSFIKSFLSIKVEDLHFMLKAALLSEFTKIVKDILFLQKKTKKK